MSNPTQFNSPSKPSGPGQIPPFDASQYQYPSYQGTESLVSPGFSYPVYLEDFVLRVVV